MACTQRPSVNQSKFLLHTEEVTYDQTARFVAYPVLLPFRSNYFYSLRVDILITHAFLPSLEIFIPTSVQITFSFQSSEPKIIA